MWLTHDAGPYAASRAERVAVALDSTTAIVESPIRNNARVHLASLEAGGEFALRWPDTASEPSSSGAPFSERFAFDSELSLQASISFDDRFGGDVTASVGTVRSAPGTPRTTVAAAAPVVPVPRAASRSVAQAAPKRPSKAGFQLASADNSLPLGYASPDSTAGSGVMGALKGLVSKGSDSPPDADTSRKVDTSRTAIYDITAHAVYLPSGRKLEAHSGLGKYMDDPSTVAMKNVGVTPPNVYDLEMRESLFHGVRAIRLIPKDESKMHGRDGILAHSYMLGSNGQSNGCVSFSNYAAFLEAYERGEITRIVVVEHLDDVPTAKTAADWFSNKLKDIFGRS